MGVKPSHRLELSSGDYPPCKDETQGLLDCLGGRIFSNKKHPGALSTGGARHPTRSKSKWGLTVASLPLPRQRDFLRPECPPPGSYACGWGRAVVLQAWGSTAAEAGLQEPAD